MSEQLSRAREETQQEGNKYHQYGVQLKQLYECQLQHMHTQYGQKLNNHAA